MAYISGSTILVGTAGKDTLETWWNETFELYGLGGDDFYIVYGNDDQIFEAAGAGIDTCSRMPTGASGTSTTSRPTSRT